MLKMQKNLTNTFYGILGLPSTAMGFALSTQIAVLSWLMNTQYGLDLHEIGIVWAAGPLGGILGQPIFGLISDKVWFWGGRRKPFIFIGSTLTALSIFALPYIGEISDGLGITDSTIFGYSGLMFIAIVVALTMDLSINISFNPTRSIIADVTPEGDARTKGYTVMQFVSGSFGVLAYFLSAVWGNYFLLYLASGLIILCSYIPAFLIEEPRELKASIKEDEFDPEELVEDEDKTNIFEYAKTLLANGFSWIGVQTMFIYTIGFVQQKINPATDDETGAILSYSFLILNAIGAILPVSLLKYAANKFGRIKTHSAALYVMALAYLFIAFSAFTDISLYGLMALAGVGWGAIVSFPFAIMTDTVDSRKMGQYMGIFNLSVVLPQLFASLVVGYFVNLAEDKSMIFIIAAVCVAISAFLWSLVKDTSKLSK